MPKNYTAAHHTTCRHCNQDIEGSAPYRRGEWRDRGNSTTCPNSKHGRKHAPYWPLNK